VDIAIAVHHYERGDGTSQYAVELVERLCRHHTVTVYAARFGLQPPREARPVRVPAATGRAYATILSFPAALRLVRGTHDLVHAQGWVTGRAEVVTTHIVLGAWRHAIRERGASTGWGERLLGGLVERREAELVRRAKIVIAPSERARRDIAELYGRERDVAVVHHAFPPAGAAQDRATARRSLGLPADLFTALYVGDPRKGLATAIRALLEAPGAHLAIVSRSRPLEFSALTARLGVTARVQWLGAQGTMNTAYAAADVLVHPTIYDTFALVVAEAMAAGVPPIVSREAGISELIDDRRSGWLVDADAPEQLGEALQALAGDGDLRARVAAEAKRTAGRRTWDDVARETDAVYASLSHD
jgi:glycosyltransferase involved in cell wall biosynthesis